jgi:tRNA nucleotidyltransferase/poly(A) polymerase
MSWPPAVEQAFAALERAGLRSFVVGGAVRDRLLGRPLRDVDLFVDADPESVLRALPGAIRIEGANPVLLLRTAPGERALEITTPRSGAAGLRADLERRDFSVNAIAFDPRADDWLDPVGGRSDLAARRLRSPRPARAFREDPVRILRGVRLAAELGFEIEAATRLAMQRDAHRLLHAPGERLWSELARLLELECASPGVEALRSLGALAVVLPELLRQVGVAQNRHHRDPVYEHALRVCDAAPQRPLLRLAALLHDVAKPDTKRWSADREDWSFLRHDVRARSHVRRAALRLRLSRRDRDRLERLVRHHLLFPRQLRTAAAVRRMVRRVGADILDDLLALRRADLISRSPQGRAPEEWLETERRILSAGGSQPAPALAIGGDEVMRCLGIEQGPEVGRWLRRARRRILESPEENDAARLLAWIRESREGEAPAGAEREGAERCTRR